MHNKFLLFIVIPFIIVGGQTESTPDGKNNTHRVEIPGNSTNPPTTFNVYIEPHIYSSAHSDAQSASNATASSIASSMSKTFSKLVNHIAPEALQQSVRSWISRIHAHWKLYTFFCSYAVIAAKIIQYNHFFEQENNWIVWKKILSIQDLQTMPHNEIARELLRAIQLKYVNQKNPTDSITPLVNFVQDVQKEKQYIQHYLWLTAMIRKCYLSKLFPFNNEQREHIQKLEQRLDFIHHIFISWAATQNLNHVTH